MLPRRTGCAGQVTTAEDAGTAGARKAAREFSRALTEGRERRPGFRGVIIIHGRRATFDELADDFPAGHAYWKKRGWLDPSARPLLHERPDEPALQHRGKIR
ncbi:hypothetical protein [Methanoculleus sp. MH98A]|uniref:hypothetical protein n=1 Tax=Methanoculleus sp. MH98A TaxID=1495314 RepID=UPI0004A0281A|nr:hypothetical protein [Methanoculleus sp. MH98A]KDE54969.1 hypothetical protein EI28_10400 [Methanoculleus sp. MH98A]